MDFFNYRRNKLYAEGVSVERLAAELGTPLYIYSERTLKRHFKVFDSAFKKVPHLVCYSIKANSNIAVINTFADEGSGFDIVSGGELYRALKAGAEPSSIVFSGVGKTAEEMACAIREGILLFNVESGGELRRLNDVAGRLGKKAPFAIRVNPDVDPKTHPYISTGLKKNKFGIAREEAIREYVYAKNNLPNLIPLGIDTHIGSQLTRVGPFVDALKKTRKLVRTLRKEGINIEYLDVGGGLGINYEGEKPPAPDKYAKAVIRETAGLGVTLIFEPGRVLVGNSGILVTRVLYTKKTPSKNFIIVDAGMNDLLRPGLYGSYHAIEPIKRRSGAAKITADVVGPICETGDFIARDREMEEVKSQDLLAVKSAGAYGYTMSSNYNSRLRAAEVLVRGRESFVIKKRESYTDLVRGEVLAPPALSAKKTKGR
ncbi:MAG: diaminopimelate decarboxylase [Thermodesulfobacteriota bacterium]